MNFVGVDVHKKYRVLCALDEGGRKLREARVEANASSGFAQFFATLEGPSKAVLEASWNWGLVHDELEELEQVEEVVLAHPHKTRLIADAQIKTDRSGRLCTGHIVARQPGGAGLCAQARDSGAQESVAATALLGAAPDHVAQPHSCAFGPAAWFGTAAVLGYFRSARSGFSAPAPIA
jgi:hypothetical protein